MKVIAPGQSKILTSKQASLPKLKTKRAYRFFTSIQRAMSSPFRTAVTSGMGRLTSILLFCIERLSKTLKPLVALLFHRALLSLLFIQLSSELESRVLPVLAAPSLSKQPSRRSFSQPNNALTRPGDLSWALKALVTSLVNRPMRILDIGPDLDAKTHKPGNSISFKSPVTVA